MQTFNKPRSMTKAQQQKGFTLIELVIVVIVLGILAVVVAKQFGTGVSSGAKAAALYESANKLSENYSLLSQTAGTPAIIGGTPTTCVTAGAGCELNVMILGTADVAATYQGAYLQSGISALTDIAQGIAGAWTVNGYPVLLDSPTTYTTCPTGDLPVEFDSVPDELVTLLTSKYGTPATVISTTVANTTDPRVQYSTEALGTRSVYLCKTL